MVTIAFVMVAVAATAAMSPKHGWVALWLVMTATAIPMTTFVVGSAVWGVAGLLVPKFRGDLLTWLWCCGLAGLPVATTVGIYMSRNQPRL